MNEWCVAPELFEEEARMAMAVKLFELGRLTSGQAHSWLECHAPLSCCNAIASVYFPLSGAMRSLRPNSKIVAAVLREAGELAAHN